MIDTILLFLLGAGGPTGLRVARSRNFMGWGIKQKLLAQKVEVRKQIKKFEGELGMTDNIADMRWMDFDPLNPVVKPKALYRPDYEMYYETKHLSPPTTGYSIDALRDQIFATHAIPPPSVGGGFRSSMPELLPPAGRTGACGATGPMYGTNLIYTGPINRTVMKSQTMSELSRSTYCASPRNDAHTICESCGHHMTYHLYQSYNGHGNCMECWKNSQL